MAIHDDIDEWRFQFIVACAETAANSARRLGCRVEVHQDLSCFTRFVELYRSLRQEFASYHDITPPNLLMNYKVAALLVNLLSQKSADEFFKFHLSVDEAMKRVIIGSFKLNIVHILCWLRKPSTPSEIELFEDLEYCLTEEVPQNIEYLCFSFHALCQSMGEKSVLEKH